MIDPREPRSGTRRYFVGTLASAAGAGLLTTQASLRAAESQVDPGDSSRAGVFDVRSFGAVGDGKVKDTRAIQAAIDACSAAGGGFVLFPPGRFLSGTISLKDHVILHLAPQATLLGSTDRADYPARPFPARDLDIGGFEVWALIHAEGARNIGIEGLGTIDGSGEAFPPLAKIPSLDVASGPRPRAIFLRDCQRVFLRDIQVRNSACWSLHLARCDDAIVDGVTIFSEHYVQQDGIILDSSRNVRVSSCRVDTADDCIVFKTSFPQPCESITVQGCVLSGLCSGLKFGTQSLGDMRNVTISNCAIHHCRLGGLKFESMDGGTIEDICVSNLAMSDVTAPVFFRIGNRGQDFGFQDVAKPRPVGMLRNVQVTGIQASLTRTATLERRGRVWSPLSGCTMIVAGLPGHPVENVTLCDFQVVMPGGGTAEHAARSDVPELEARYPENDMFGVLPAWGFYIRHARALSLANMRIELAGPDHRPSILADDVEDLELDRLTASTGESPALIRLRGVRRALIRGCRTLGDVESFLQLDGNENEHVALMSNDLRWARRICQDPDGVQAQGNLTSG